MYFSSTRKKILLSTGILCGCFIIAGFVFWGHSSSSPSLVKEEVVLENTALNEAASPVPTHASHTTSNSTEVELAYTTNTLPTPTASHTIVPTQAPIVENYQDSKPLELDIVANQVMMRLSRAFQDFPREEKDKLLATYGVKILKEFPYAGNSVLLEISGAPSAEAGKLPAGETKASVHQRIDDIIEQLEESGIVEYAEPDAIMQTTATPNDTRYGELWGLQKIQAEQAWNTVAQSNPTPAEIVIGVIDTGVDYNHPDLASNMWVNSGEIAGDGIDNDGNGYIDDIHGWDAFNNDGDPMDDHYHGTHVAGTIAAVRDNNEGITGVTPYVKIMALKFLGSGGLGYSSDAVELLNYVHMMKQVHNVNIRITNNSWGGGGYNQTLRDAIDASGDQNILFVAAAGNDTINTDSTPAYPASFTLNNIISVAATDSADELAYFSNYGATSVDIAAPGVSILSTYPNNTYNYLSGTSMAAPHVAGVAGLLLSMDSSLSYIDVKDRVIQGADVIAGLGGATANSSRLNAYGVLLPTFFEIEGEQSLSISEGTSVEFRVRLNNSVDTSINAAVTIEGDSDISVASSPTLLFEPHNWSEWQTVSLTALEDSDSLNGSATVRISSTNQRSALILVTENDNDSVCISTTEIPTSECEALEALYHATDGDNWSNNSNWLGPNPCSWHGVYCNSITHHISGISLSSNGLSGELPTQLSQLTELTYLYLGNNQLRGEIPASLGSLSKIHSLLLYSNELTGTIPASLGNLSDLSSLRINGNQLTGEIPASLGNLTRLVTLSLSDNQLTGTIPTELGNLSHVRSFYLDINHLEGNIPSELGLLSSVSFMGFSNNRLNGEIPESFIHLPNLSSLHISYNALEFTNDTVIAFLDEVAFSWVNQTVTPTNFNVDAANDQLTLTWTPIDYRRFSHAYIISYADSIDGPFTELGRTNGTYASSYNLSDSPINRQRYYSIQSYTPASGQQINNITSPYSDPIRPSDILLTVGGPVITPPTALSIDAASPAGVAASYLFIRQFLANVTAVDGEDGVITTITHDAPAIFPAGITPVTFTACDSENNCNSVIQFVTVSYDPAAPAPTVTAPANLVIEATGQSTSVTLGVATATDVIDGVLIATPSQTGPFTLGEHNIVWTATNSSGKSSVSEQVVTIQDTTAPMITPVGDLAVEATAVLTSVSIEVATASDLVDGSLVPTVDLTGPFAVGTHILTWRATDSAGNEGSASQSITVRDTTSPILHTPQDVIVTAPEEINIGHATATDIFSTTIQHDAPTQFPLGKTTVTWTATDLHGNVATAAQIVTMNPFFANHSSHLACEKGDDGHDTVWVMETDNDAVSVMNVSRDSDTNELVIDTMQDYFIFTDSGPSSVTRVNNYVAMSYADTGRIRFSQMDSPWWSHTTVPWSSWVYSVENNERPVASVAHNNMLYVALYASGEILKIDTETRTEVSRLKVGPKPKAMALSSDGSRLLVTRFISTADYGEVYDINTAGNMSFRDPAQPTIQINKVWVPDDIDHGSGVPNYLRGIVIDPNDQYAYVTANKANIDRGTYLSGQALSADNTVRSMVAVIDLTSHQDINSDSLTRDGTIDLQGAADPSSISFLPNGKTRVYALQGNNRVEFYHAAEGDDAESILPVATGMAPQALCATSDTLYVKNYTDRSVTVIDLADYFTDASTPITAQAALVNPADDTLSTQELTGLQLFYSAQSEISPLGYMSCASCHDGGGHDGMTWDFTQLGEGLRNTPSLRGGSGNRFGPMNWSGNADEVQDIEKQLEQLHGSNGFIPGVTFTDQSAMTQVTSGLSSNLDALSSYVTSLGRDSVMQSPTPCNWDDSACWSTYYSGSWQYYAYGCTDCHTRDGSDGSYRDGQRHNMGTTTTASGQVAGSTLTSIRTPTLIELWDSAPYLHDGSAETLDDVMQTGVHANYGLDEREMRNLLQFIRHIDRAQYIDD